MSKDDLLNSLDNFTTSYAETALWSSTNPDTEETLDSSFGIEDISEETLQEMINDCESFQEECSEQIENMDPSQAGHDFWLTRNRHGAGFWTRGLGAVGDDLTEAAHAYGSVDLMVCDGEVCS